MIKNLLTLITFLPLFVSAQTSWVAFRLETDTHPNEFSWYVEDVATDVLTDLSPAERDQIVLPKHDRQVGLGLSLIHI